MIVTHYLELLRYYRWLVTVLVVSITLTACGLSLLVLFVAPLYTASTSVTMLPTRSELAFTSDMLQSGQINAATMLIQTHMEYLLSRPVAEKTIAKMNEAMASDSDAGVLEASLLATLARETISSLRRVYNLLNYGEHIPLNPYESAIDDLRNSIDLETVEGSFVLLIEVTSLDPKAAAAAANGLAEAYVGQLQEDVNATANVFSLRMTEDIASRETKLAALDEKELNLRQELGILDPTLERRSLLDARETERAKLQDDEVEVAGLTARVETLEAMQEEFRRMGMSAQISEESAFSAARLAALEKQRAVRTRTLESVQAKLADLAKKEKVLFALNREREQYLLEIANLNNRLSTLELSGISAMSQIRIIDPAVAPIYPSFPKVLINTAIGLTSGIFISLFLLVGIDTTSNTVKTSVDLNRVVGERSYGLLPVSIAKALRRSDRPLRGAPRRSLRKHAEGLMRRFVFYGNLGSKPIVLAGLGSASTIHDGALVMAAAIAQQGHRVNFVAAPGERLPVKPRAFEPGELRFGTPDGDDNEAAAIQVRSLGTDSSVFDETLAKPNDPLFICLLTAGELTEGMILEYQRAAKGHGIEELLFVLVAG